jgi:preprotein translocase subunit SecD
MRGYRLWLVVILAVAAMSIWMSLPDNPGIHIDWNDDGDYDDSFEMNRDIKVVQGLDLQGGTSFMVEMDTNRLVTVEVETVTNRAGQVETRTNVVAETDVAGVLAQAVEVLRKRVDKFGVAEPIIQPAGANRILVQLPGLSEADRESAQRQIQRAAFQDQAILLQFLFDRDRAQRRRTVGLAGDPDGGGADREYIVGL